MNRLRQHTAVTARSVAALLAPAARLGSSARSPCSRTTRCCYARGDAARRRSTSSGARRRTWSRSSSTGPRRARRAQRKPAGFDGRRPGRLPAAGQRYDGSCATPRRAASGDGGAQRRPLPAGPRPRRGDRRAWTGPSAREFARFAQAAAGATPPSTCGRSGTSRTIRASSTRSRAARVPVRPHLYRALVRAARRRACGARARRRPRSSSASCCRSARRGRGRRSTCSRSSSCASSSASTEHAPVPRPRGPRRGCRATAALTGVDGFAYHPYTRPSGPRAARADPRRRHDPLARPRHAGARPRARRGRIGGGRLQHVDHRVRLPVQPAGPLPGPARAHPGVLGRVRVARLPQPPRGELVAVHDGRHTAGRRRLRTWQGGLRFANGSAKPGVYNAYRLPLFVRLLGPSAVEVLGRGPPRRRRRRGPDPASGRKGALRQPGRAA